MSQAESLKSSYIDWLKKELIFTDIEDGYISISTPFVDNNYDNIELFAKFVSESQIEVTDFGETLFNLEDNGLKITKQSKTIYRLFENTLNDFGIEYNCNTETLSITTDVRRFPTAKNRLLQAIMRINDLLYLIKENVNELKVFKFDVRETSNTRDSKYVLLLNDSNTAIRDQMKMNALVGLDDNLAEVIGFEKIQNDPSLLVATYVYITNR